jgi:hypothetical protein
VFGHRVSRMPESFANIIAFEIRVSAQYICLAHAIGDHRHHEATGMRKPRMQGTPLISRGSVAIPVKFTVSAPKPAIRLDAIIDVCGRDKSSEPFWRGVAVTGYVSV